ncbi:hypothetical protein ZTR_00415 [Talaromyces verruculosus]|nr:hypothetical protein ZTR_00415 [Talaromyces verruculosus]
MIEDGPKEVERLARKMAKELSSTVLNTDNSAFEKVITDTNNNPITTRIVLPRAERAKRNTEVTEKLHKYFEDLRKLTGKYFHVIKQADKDRWDRIKLGVKLPGALASAYGVGKGVHKAAYILQTIVQQLDELAEAREAH